VVEIVKRSNIVMQDAFLVTHIPGVNNVTRSSTRNATRCHVQISTCNHVMAALDSVLAADDWERATDLSHSELHRHGVAPPYNTDTSEHQSWRPAP